MAARRIEKAIRRGGHRQLGMVSPNYNIEFYPDASMQNFPGMHATGSGQKPVKTKGLRRLLDNIGSADAKTKTALLRKYQAAYRKFPGNKKLLHVIQYLKRITKGKKRKRKNGTRKVFI